MTNGIHPTKTPARIANLENLFNFGPAYITGRVGRDLERLGLVKRIYAEGAKKGVHQITESGLIFINRAGF